MISQVLDTTSETTKGGRKRLPMAAASFPLTMIIIILYGIFYFLEVPINGYRLEGFEKFTY